MAFTSNKLTHWVGRGKRPAEQYRILTKEILAKKRLLFSNSPLKFRSKYGGLSDEYRGNPQICFTDIPLTEATTGMCKRYSPFGIMFEKTYLANCLASPVGYVLNPFVYQNFSEIFHTLSGIKSLVDGKIIPEGIHKGKQVDVSSLISKFMYIIASKSSYSTTDFVHNESPTHGPDPDPVPGQEKYFEDRNALYFEREWRIIFSGTGPGEDGLPIGKQSSWISKENGKAFFNYKEEYVPYLVVPRKYKSRMLESQGQILSDWKAKNYPSIIAYEDLHFM